MFDYSHGSEKRSDRRLQTEYALEFCLTEQDRLIPGHTVDLSVGGLRLFTTEKIPVAADVDVRLSVGEPPLILEFSGRVAHVSESGEDGYLVGLRYTNIDTKTRAMLDEHLKSIDVIALLSVMADKKASDLHLVVDHPPMYRIQQELLPQGTEQLSAERVRRMIYSVMDSEQAAQLRRRGEITFALTVSGVGRWRVNVHRQQGRIEAVYRAINDEIVSLDRLGLPPQVTELARTPDGLVIVAGGGDSTTLTAMIDLINGESRKVIVTLEDPIEFVHQGKMSVIKQREIGSDIRSFADGLNNILRLDPDVIVIGEIRDCHTLSAALKVADSGRLVLASLPASNTIQAVNRLLGMYPPDQRPGIAVGLSGTLRGIIAQRLIPRADRSGMVVATEILLANSAVRAVIREMEIHEIPKLILAESPVGMHSMDSSLWDLAARGLITIDTARALAEEPLAFEGVPDEIGEHLQANPQPIVV